MRYLLLILVLPLFLLSCTNQPSLVDIDGNKYSTKRINGRLWMTENLKVKHDPQGNPIKYIYPDSSEANFETYGLLYEFKNAQKACPKGWKLPTHDEWENLIDLENAKASDYKDPQFWDGSKNSNSTGFTVRPAGSGNNGQWPNRFGERTLFWSSTIDDDHYRWTYIFEENKDKVRKAHQHPTYGFSVRCIKKK